MRMVNSKGNVGLRDEALTFLGDLWAQVVVKPMAYNSEWVIFLSTPFADEFTTGKSAQVWEDKKSFISINLQFFHVRPCLLSANLSVRGIHLPCKQRF